MLHGLTLKRAVLAEHDAERAWAELESLKPEKPKIARSFTEAFQCKKRQYGSESAAIQASKSLGHTMRTYQCPTCHKWHTTKRDYQ